MKIYFETLALTLLLSFLAGTKITLWPFSISFARGWLALGIILIVCGCICLKAQWYEEGLRRGAEIKEEVEQEVKDQKIKSDI